MKLYYSPGACSLASHIALHETGLPFEIEKVDFATKKTAGGEDFNQINPKSYVPTIRLDDGSILIEGGAVLQYIADQQPASGLAPKAGTMERYRLQEWLTFTGVDLTPFPKLMEYMARVGARPKVQAAMQAEGLKK